MVKISIIELTRLWMENSERKIVPYSHGNNWRGEMKVLVDVRIPAIASHFDAWLPDCLLIKELIQLVVDAVVELSDHKYVSSGHECFCTDNPPMLLNENETLKKYEIKNGDCLFLL
jgi:uncharacterized ubiquitin-like protein YukD